MLVYSIFFFSAYSPSGVFVAILIMDGWCKSSTTFLVVRYIRDGSMNELPMG